MFRLSIRHMNTCQFCASESQQVAPQRVVKRPILLALTHPSLLLVLTSSYTGACGNFNTRPIADGLPGPHEASLTDDPLASSDGT